MMVKVNCAALTASLVESELFGHEKGAFTGAISQKKGRFEVAHKARSSWTKSVNCRWRPRPSCCGCCRSRNLSAWGAETLKVDVRVIAATNRTLRRKCVGSFRSDLYYRLNVFPIQVPPLRDRKEDIRLLANEFVRKSSQRMGKRVSIISREALEKLENYDWPGNVRELANIIERAVILCDGKSSPRKAL